MKSTGIIRRIDELGRVVIPKEIRKSMNLKDGTEVEIFTRDESLILQKHSSMQNLETLATEAADVLRNILGLETLVVDTEKVIVAESVYRDKVGQRLSERLIDTLNGRKSKIIDNPLQEITIDDDVRYSSVAVSPIVVCGDLAGGIVCFSTKSQISESDLKSIDVLSGYIVKRLEF